MRCRTLLAASCFALAAIGQQPALLGGNGLVEGRVVDLRGDGVPAARVRVVRHDDPTKARRRPRRHFVGILHDILPTE